MRYTILFLALLINFYALSQPTPDYHYLDEYAHPHKSNFSAQINVGFTALDGNSCTLREASDQNHYLNPHLSLGLGYQLTHYISLIARTSYYRMNCSSPTDLGGEGMVSNNFSGILAVKHSFFPVREFDEHTRDYNLYALAGAGVMLLNPKNAESGEGFDKNSDFSKTALVVPIGIGGEYRLSSFFSMALEITYHVTSSDYLDAGLVETSSSNRDNFATFGVNVSYRIPRKSFNYNNFLKFKNRPGVEE
jgi:opacity protein-like surface antigen